MLFASLAPHHAISSSWMRNSWHSCSSFSHTPTHTPWSSGAPCTWAAWNPLSCSALTARSHCSCVIACVLVVGRARTIVVRLLVVSRILGGGGTGCDGGGQNDRCRQDVSQTFHCSLNFRKLGCAIASSMVVHCGVLISVPSVICRQLSSGAYMCRSNPFT